MAEAQPARRLIPEPGTIFDPVAVKANATPRDGGLPSTGIPYVVVNGTVVVKDSKVQKGVFPGKPIRLPV